MNKPTSPTSKGQLSSRRSSKNTMMDLSSEIHMNEHNKNTCVICAETPVTYWSISSCHHPLCFKCSLRLRELFQNKLCPICKTLQQIVLFSKNSDDVLDRKKLDSNPMIFFDDKLNIYFSDDKLRSFTMTLLSLQCPVDNCKVILAERSHLISHVKQAHSLEICALCFSHRKAFLSEVELYPNMETLMKHIRESGNTKNQQGGRHPLCGFCKVNYYSLDELYEHCRLRHEVCHLCQSLGKHHQYFENYTFLEKHFELDHFLCKDKICLEKKFVVFQNEMQLKTHNAREHKIKGQQRSVQRQVLSINIDLQAGTISEDTPRSSQLRPRELDMSTNKSSISLSEPLETGFPSLASQQVSSKSDPLIENLKKSFPLVSDPIIIQFQTKFPFLVQSIIPNKENFAVVASVIIEAVKGTLTEHDFVDKMTKFTSAPNSLTIVKTLIECFPITDKHFQQFTRAYERLLALSNPFPSLPISSKPSFTQKNNITYNKPKTVSPVTTKSLSSGTSRPSFTEIAKNPSLSSSTVRVPLTTTKPSFLHLNTVNDEDYPSLVPSQPQKSKLTWVEENKSNEATTADTIEDLMHSFKGSVFVKKKGSKKNLVLKYG